MKHKVILVFCAAILTFCTKPKEVDEDYKEVRKEINTFFKGAIPYDDYTDSLLVLLYAVHKISPTKILLGQSVCVDDILHTKNPFADHKIKGPFNFGGLAGLPFASETVIEAFTSHVPDSGAAVLFMGPHIGYSTRGGWGKIEREGQHELTMCCGALSNALKQLKPSGTKPEKAHGTLNYQEKEIQLLAEKYKEEILSSKEPLIAFTKIMCREIETRVQPSRLKNSKFKYIILINGVIINTDHMHPDYIWVDHMTVYDLETHQELEHSGSQDSHFFMP